MLSIGTKVHAQTVNLDTAINSAVDAVYSKLKIGSKIAILNISSSSTRMSNYIIEELTSVFINQQLITVVDRSQLIPIQQEMNLQASSEISGSSAQAIGKRLGVQFVITGSFEPVADYYRFRVRVIDVQTAAILLTHSTNVQNDKVVASLMGMTLVGSDNVSNISGNENPFIGTWKNSNGQTITFNANLTVTSMGQKMTYTYSGKIATIDFMGSKATATIENDGKLSWYGGTWNKELGSGGGGNSSTDYQDFTPIQRWQTWAFNTMLPGIGSYLIMKDNEGCAIQVIAATVGLGFTVGGVMHRLIGLENVATSYKDKIKESSTGYIDKDKKEEMEREIAAVESLSTFLMVCGGVILAGDFIYNIVRSNTYHKPRPKLKLTSINDPTAWNLVVIPSNEGIEQVSLSYTMRF